MTEPASQSWRIGRDRALILDRPALMGILNITPDSFSDGGLHLDPLAAVDAALHMVDEGAVVLDIGGESTRPGAQAVDAAEQRRRVLPVIERLRASTTAAISIDTTLTEVARAALDAGAAIVNDISAGRDDSEMFKLAAERGCGLILMHRLRRPEEDSYSTQCTAAEAPTYGDLVEEIARFLEGRAREAIDCGVDPAAIVLDPGLGFGKTAAQNFELIARIDEIAALGHPVLGAASRKSFLDPSRSIEPRHRVPASIAAAVAMHERDVRLFRVHDVAAHRDALAIAAAVASASPTREPHDPLRS